MLLVESWLLLRTTIFLQLQTSLHAGAQRAIMPQIRRSVIRKGISTN